MSHPSTLDVVALARSLAPTLRARADEVESARRLPPDLSAQLARSGLYRLWAPACYGGLELPLDPVLRALELLAQADGSVAWCVFIAITSSTTLGFIPADAAREIFAKPETLIGGVFAPAGRAQAAPGGFRVSGQWPFGSGTQNADWVCAGCQFLRDGEPIPGPDGAPRQHMVIVPARDVEFLDTWHVSGLCGTGSCDFRIDDVLVPESRVVAWREQDRLERALYQFPQLTLLALGIAPIALGLARAAIDELVTLAASKRPTGARRLLGERADVQASVARAEASLRSARAWLFEVVDAAWRNASTGARVTLEQRRDLRLATSHAVQAAVGVVDAMYTLAGSSAIYRRSTLQRIFRDVHVVTQHLMVGPTSFELAGRAFLGIDKDTSLL